MSHHPMARRGDPAATELTPFGGTKESGLGVKEAVIEAMRAMTFTKLYTLPWE